MRWFVVIGLLGLMLVGNNAYAEDQAKLDAACEQAREKKLVPLRKQLTADCIAEGKKDRKQCEAEYADHTGRMGNNQLPFYDLPECEKAFQNRKGTER